MKTISIPDLEDATEQLMRSDRGKDALTLLLQMLDNGGVSLDLSNQRAFRTLLDGAWGAYAMTARDIIREAIYPEPDTDDSPQGHESVLSFDDDSIVPNPR